MGVPIEKMEEFLEKERMSKKIIDIFKKHGIVEIEQLFLLDVENIMAILGCSEEYANDVLKVARRAYGANFPEPITASQYKVEEVIVETPLPSLNNLLGGGFKAGTLVEIAGPFASAKTQFLFTQSVLEAAKGNYVLFIDTEKTFSPQRIREIIVNRFGAEKVEEIMNRILVFEALSSTELRAVVLFLIRIIPKYIQEGKKVSLICIDSLVNPFRAEYSVEGLAKLAERQQVLNWTLRQLLKIAHIYRIVVIFTNQVVAAPGSPAGFVPSGGNIVAHASTIRIMLSRAGENKRRLKIYDAPDLPSVEITFKITEKGIEE